jgi:GT2 family glycosyltransferase
MDRRQAKDLAKTVLRPLGLHRPAAWGWRQLRRVKNGLARRVAALSAPRQATATEPGVTEPAAEPDDGLPHGYDVICLPVILWNSRFQRPQQMMQELAARGHRVFYASLGFHSGAEAELSPLVPGVCEMLLPGTPGTSVYQQLPSPTEVERMAAAIDRLRATRRITSAVVVVQLPFWTALAERLREQFHWPVVYDCMDDHSGFSTNCDAMLRAEQRTITTADLVVVTSEVLHQKVQGKARRTAVIRNACDYEHFAQVLGLGSSVLGMGAKAEDRRPKTQDPRPKTYTVGFYGAIAEWFDSSLVADLAELRPQWRFDLIGNTFTGDVTRLKRLANVALLGERPYADLPRLMADWDCCIVPFRRIPLTEATNPVKAYEMLAAGKPVVAVDLPELRPMGREGLVSLADDAAGFARAIEQAVAGDGELPRARRRAFAAQNTWQQRCDAMEGAVRPLFPLASIVVVTYNNLHLNQMCLQSIFRQTDYPNFEVIVVDNASTDGTAEWLAHEAAHYAENDLVVQAEKGDCPRPTFGRCPPERPKGCCAQMGTVPFFRPRLRVIHNTENRGFSAANNQGLRAARGDFLCLLNNDTVVAGGWLSTLIGHLRSTPGVGMVGPTSNMVGNEAKVPVGYAAIEDMPRWTAAYCRLHDGETLPMPMLGFFCVLLPREICEAVGELDEQFGVGYFEDTDYCCRVLRHGYQLRCARDAFVHHWQGASFRLLGDDSFADIYRNNQRLFEAKWGADCMAGAY